MIRENKAKKIMKNGGAAIGTFMSFNDPSCMEVLCRLGFDFVVVDNEHVSMDRSAIANLMRASESSGLETTPIVRLRDGTPSEILQMLDLGAMGVQVPNVHTVEYAKQIISSTYYQPKGNRGMGSLQRAIGHGFMERFEYYAMANSEALNVIQCESVECVNNLDQILELDDIDVIFVGAMDLSHSMGEQVMGRLNHPELVKTVDDTLKKIVAAGKIAGAVAGDPNQIRKMLDIGVKYLCLGQDMIYMRMAAANSLDMCRKIVEEYN